MNAAVQALSGNGFSHDYPLVALRDWTRFLRIAPVNNEIVLNYVGENLLDMPGVTSAQAAAAPGVSRFAARGD